MKAIVYKKYGHPDVLRLEELEKPAPGDNDLLIKVHATTVTATDCIFRGGRHFLAKLYTGLRKPKYPILGDEFAGIVEAAGKDVTSFKAGDQVFGTSTGHGTYSEYICLGEKEITLAHKPGNLTFEEAVAGCDGFLTALSFLRDTGKIQRGQEVLVVGASGSVGSAAVQLAGYFEARVTGVCSGANLELVKELGADEVIDYTQEDFSASGLTYDIIFDTVGKTPYSGGKRALKPHGVFLEAVIVPGILPRVLWSALFGGGRLKISATGMRPPAERSQDLAFIAELLEQGRIRPVIDRRYPFAQLAEAHAYVDLGHKKGNVVIAIPVD